MARSTVRAVGAVGAQRVLGAGAAVVAVVIGCVAAGVGAKLPRSLKREAEY